jgi:3-deoxy-D-manno-octulosonic-acid transferase
VKVRSRGELPDADTEVFVADSFAEMGLWYALSGFALIGGTFSDVEGHNPWEALQLDCGVMHGPRYGNFTSDYDALIEAQACFRVYNAEDIVDTITTQSSRGLDGYRHLQRDQNAALSDLAERLVGMIKP